MPVVLLVLAAVVAGAWVGARRPSATVNAVGSGPLVIDPPAVHTERAVPLAPEHLLSGGNLVPHAFSRHVERALPAAKSVVLDDCGHVPQYELPDQTHELVRGFFDEE